MLPEGIAWVTGASRGIGRAVALELAARGFEVVAGMRDPVDGQSLAADAKARGGRLSVQKLDVTQPGSVSAPDGLRVLVNNAGIDTEYLPVEHAPMESWRELFETNLFGVVEMTRRALPSLRRSGGGVICNVTSCSILVPMPFFAAYRASKAAVSALGESLRAEVAPLGIRVVEIQPGAIATDMLTQSNRAPEAVALKDYRELAQKVFEMRAAVDTASTGTRADRAATSIVDAILDDGAPLRNACDPMGEGLLQSWREKSDEEMMRGMLEALAPPGR